MSLRWLPRCKCCNWQEAIQQWLLQVPVQKRMPRAAQRGVKHHLVRLPKRSRPKPASREQVALGVVYLARGGRRHPHYPDSRRRRATHSNPLLNFPSQSAVSFRCRPLLRFIEGGNAAIQTSKHTHFGRWANLHRSCLLLLCRVCLPANLGPQSGWGDVNRLWHRLLQYASMHGNTLHRSGTASLFRSRFGAARTETPQQLHVCGASPPPPECLLVLVAHAIAARCADESALSAQVTCHTATPEIYSHVVASTLFTNGSTLLDIDQQPAPQPAMSTKLSRPLSQRSIRSLSALALIDCRAASPYSSWADSYSCKAAKAAPAPQSNNARLVRTLPVGGCTDCVRFHVHTGRLHCFQRLRAVA